MSESHERLILYAGGLGQWGKMVRGRISDGSWM
jgi:hypothetical protein